MGERTANVMPADMGEVISSLAATIASRAEELPEGSYTAALLTAKPDKLLGKIVEEAAEVVMAAKDDDHDHIRYEMADLLYHLLVTAQKYGIGIDELAGELAARMG